MEYAREKELIFRNMDRIVFAGDSVTDMGSEQPVGESFDENLGRSYVRIIDNMLSTWYPEILVRVTNSGISGNTSRDLLERYQRDVIDLNPDWVSICIGINDVWRQFDSPAMADTHVMPEEYEANLEKMILAVKDSVKGIFLMTPYYMEPNAEDGMRKRMDEYGAVCRKLAVKYGCVFIDLQETFNHYFRFRHSTYIAWDRIHPSLVGATIIAREFLKHCGFDYDHIA
ncbi:SGNH/GDSL hydrolase family protein [bacterium]|nr:SGNH/GDSL hydrolase family protein [bacterium]MDY3022212.1 SGNH/GDSL hydrolase family protein [Oliverpabstia sp.]